MPPNSNHDVNQTIVVATVNNNQTHEQDRSKEPNPRKRLRAFTLTLSGEATDKIFARIGGDLRFDCRR